MIDRILDLLSSSSADPRSISTSLFPRTPSRLTSTHPTSPRLSHLVNESRSAQQAFCLSDSLPCSLAGWTPLLCWEVLVSIPPLFQPVLYQHKRTYYPSPLINGRAGAGARPAPCKPKWSEREDRREEGKAGLPQLWFWSLSLSPCSAPSLHLLTGSFGDTRLGQAPGTRESGPG